MKHRLVLAILSGTALLCATVLQAQTSRATLTGVVLGANGKPVANAAVSCQASSGSNPRAVHTDSKGRFYIPGLKQESYDLRASADGAYSDWERNIPLKKGQTKMVTLWLLNGNDKPAGPQPAKQKQKQKP